MSAAHIYEASVEWTGGRNGDVTAEGLPRVKMSAPPEFSGEAGNWTPEHFLVAAAASCLMTTFVAIAEFSGMPVAAVRIRSSARLERVPGSGFQFTEIVLEPEITVAETDLDRAHRILEKAEKACFVSNALKTPPRVNAEFKVQSSKFKVDDAA